MLANRPRCLLRVAGPWLLLGVLGAAHDLPWADAVGTLTFLIAWAVISVAWCRVVLLSGPCPLGGNLGRRELLYLRAGLVIMAPAVLAVWAPVIVAEAAAPLHRAMLNDLLERPWFLWSIGEAGHLAFLTFIARFQMAFPAIALNDPTITFRSSFRLTRGSAFGIFVGSVVATLPILVPSPSWWLPDDVSHSLTLFVTNVIDDLTSAVSAIVVAGFCAQLYRRHRGGLASVFE